jgi:molybdopterin synthase catalytic subunit
MSVEPVIRIQNGDFDSAAEVAAMTAGRRDIGAVVTFTGLCRDEGGQLSALELEHYPGMAEAEIGRICREAAKRWPLQAITVVHRHGRIEPGQNIVLVATASPHRHAAFEAASFVMDFLKSNAPFWKKEHDAQGRAGGWVDAKDSDEAALERWKR